MQLEVGAGGICRRGVQPRAAPSRWGWGSGALNQDRLVRGLASQTQSLHNPCRCLMLFTHLSPKDVSSL